MLPISTAIIILLTIVYFSYRQTIAGLSRRRRLVYGGAPKSRSRAQDLLAAAALMIDYVLVVAVGISAGVGALVSAVPWSAAAHAESLPWDSGSDHAGQPARHSRIRAQFSWRPTYRFVVTLLAAIAIGLFKTFACRRPSRLQSRRCLQVWRQRPRPACGSSCRLSPVAARP